MPLPRIEGSRLDGRSLPSYTWNADLIFFEGPLLSLFKSENDYDALFIWLDCDDRRNRWAIVDISRDNLKSYLCQNISLMHVVHESKSLIVFDATATARKTRIVKTVWAQLPQEYLPRKDSFLVDEISTPAAKALKEDRVESYCIKLDGELYIDDLASVPRLFQQLYSFHYGLEHLGREAVSSALSRLVSNWHGGVNAVNLFSGLKSVTPSIHRVRLEHLQYNSPGHITMELLPQMAQRIKIAADRVSQNFDDSEALYKSVYKFFKENKISGFDDERAKKNRILTDIQLQQLQGFIDQFFELMQWNDYRDKFIAIDATPLSQMRALLAYYRRLRRLLRYAESGQIELT